MFFYKQVIHTGTLFWFQIYCAWSTTQAMDYVYLLLYNAIWTVAAVVFIGIFDQPVSARVLMEVPELYRSSRLGKYFGLGRFSWYMLDGTYQSAVLFFFMMYFYESVSARPDGYNVSLYEATTPMVTATVLAANLYCGLETRMWSWFIVFAVFIGPVVLLVFEPIYAALQPSLTWTYSWSNNYTLYRAVQFWLGGLFCVILALLPRFLFEYVQAFYFPSDTDICRLIEVRDPKHDFVHDPRMPGIRAAQAYEPENGADPDASMRSATGADSYPLMPTHSRASSVHYDMSTGRESLHRGYSFAAEDLPRTRRETRMRALRDKLKPRNLLKKRRKRESSSGYIRVRDSHMSQQGEAITCGDSDTGHAEQPSTAAHTTAHDYDTSPQVQAQPRLYSDSPLFGTNHFDSTSSVSTAFHTAADHDPRAGTLRSSLANSSFANSVPEEEH